MARDVAAFRGAVRDRRRLAGRSQTELARVLALHPQVLSRKLNEHGAAMLTTPEVVRIVTALADWGAISTRPDAEALLATMAVPAHAVPASAWSSGPLAGLDSGEAQEAEMPMILDTPRPRLFVPPLPAALTPLVGRAAELAEVAAAVTSTRLVTLTGVGGTGKTRLALATATDLADRFPDGAAFIDLAPVRDPQLVALALARTFGLSAQSAQSAEEQLADTLRTGRLLLLADNFEHVLDAAPLMTRLLSAAPGLRVLVTSRVPLHLSGEQQIRVPPLQLPPRPPSPVAEAAPSRGWPAPEEIRAAEAVQLFVQRARAAVSGFDVDGAELVAAGEICALLDGLPLAIELAAPWVKVYPPTALLPLLSDRLSVLTGGPRDVAPRQQALLATLQWSEALLPPAARHLLARLGVFAGSFHADAAAALWDATTHPPEDAGGDGPAGMLERLRELAEHSMVEVIPSANPRFRLLQTVREYALARLDQSSEAEAHAVRRAHLRYYLAKAVAARPALYGPGQGETLVQLETDVPDVDAAVNWVRAHAVTGQERGCLEDGLRLAAAVSLVWHRRALMAASVHHLESLLAMDAAAASTTPAVRSSALLEACALACYRGNYDSATAFALEALALCRQLADLSGCARAHRYLAECALGVGDWGTAQTHVDAETAYAAQSEDLQEIADAHNMLGHLLRYEGRYDAAADQFDQCLRAFDAAHDPSGVACALQSLGDLARDRGVPDRALASYQQALRLHEEAQDLRGVTGDLEGLAAATALQGDGRTALGYLAAAHELRSTRTGPLPPVDSRILARLLSPAVGALTPAEREQALEAGRGRRLSDIIDQALHDPQRVEAGPVAAAVSAGKLRYALRP